MEVDGESGEVFAVHKTFLELQRKAVLQNYPNEANPR